MPRNFKLSLPSAASLREPRIMVRAALGALLFSNLIAAAFAFHLIGASPEALSQQVAVALTEKQTAQAKLNRSRVLTGNIGRGKEEGDKFLASYMTSRRYTFSTVIGELNESSKASGMKMLEATIAP